MESGDGSIQFGKEVFQSILGKNFVQLTPDQWEQLCQIDDEDVSSTLQQINDVFGVSEEDQKEQIDANHRIVGFYEIFSEIMFKEFDCIPHLSENTIRAIESSQSQTKDSSSFRKKLETANSVFVKEEDQKAKFWKPFTWKWTENVKQALKEKKKKEKPVEDKVCSASVGRSKWAFCRDI